MDDVLLQKAIKLNKERKRRNRWQKAVRVMGAVVVFCTTYALILPAITMEKDTICGMEEHEHSEDCYSMQASQTLQCLDSFSDRMVLHSHADLCYDADGELICSLPQILPHSHSSDCYAQNSVIVCEIPEAESHTHDDSCYESAAEPLCGLSDAIHTHDDSCYSITDTVICGLTEEPAHCHDSSCYEAAQDPLCGLSEAEPHTHGESCFAPEPSLSCSLEECEGHSHTDACYSVTSVPGCGIEESAPHAHTSECYQTQNVLICTEEETDAHAHTDACYEQQQIQICLEAEGGGHSHEDGCYVEQKNLECSLEEQSGHAHLDACYTPLLICTQPESEGHLHDSTCLQILVCQQRETEGHTHSESCHEKVLTCTKSEDASHTHDDSCTKVLICQQEENEGHTHDDSCKTETVEELICQMQELIEHSHNEGCFDSSGSNICVLQEIESHVHSEECLNADEVSLTCELPVHIHDDTCYPEETTLPTEEGFICGYGRHTHGDSCYSEDGTLTCSIPEHTHIAQCVVEDYDANADVESQADWEASFSHIPLTGNWHDDVLAIAESQIGYTESIRNCRLSEDDSLKGYTRYGDWYGSPYDDWCAMFASFCLHYGGVENVPLDSICQPWIEKLQNQGLYRIAGSYTPSPGDLIFFDWDAVQDGTGISDHVGLVAEVILSDEGTPTQIKTIEGNSANSVRYCTYSIDDPTILGYGQIPPGKYIQLSYHGADFTVTVTYDASANIPLNAVLDVREIKPGSEEYETYFLQAMQAVQDAAQSEADISFARFFDITFISDGQVIEPAAPVEVSISYADAVEIDPEEESVAVHFADEGVEVLDAEASQTETEEESAVDTFVFTQGSFSVSGTVITNSGSARASSGIPDLTNAENLQNYITSLQILNGRGVESSTFVDGDSFTLIIDATVPAWKYAGNSGGKTLYLTLNDVMQLTGYTGSDNIQDPLLDAASNAFIMVAPADPTEYYFNDVSFHLELTGKAVNQTGGVATVTIKDTICYIYHSAQRFTHTLSDGSVCTLDLMGSSYTPTSYELVVEPIDESGYTQTLSSYVTSNYPRRTLQDTAAYRVYLRSIENPNQQVPIPGPYNLEINFAASPVAVESSGFGIISNLSNGSAAAPGGFALDYQDQGVSSITISDPHNSLSTFAVCALSRITAGTSNSGYSLNYNSQTDSFLKDPAYAVYNNANSPIGTAGSFHIVAFNTANLNAHTNGNVLAKNVYANSNFGTKGYPNELSYIQNYLKVNASSASLENHILVVGSNNEIKLYDNNTRYQINGQNIDTPKNIVQDIDTATAPFIDLNRVRAEILQISANLVGYPNQNLNTVLGNQRNLFELTDPDAVGILNVKSSDADVFGKGYIQLGGFQSGHNGSIVINVDCAGATTIQMPTALVVMDGTEQSTDEVTEFSNGKVLWNFINAEGVTIEAERMTGMIIAPGATVNINQNLNGTVVADNVNVNAESHRTDFTGKIIPQEDDSDETDRTVILQKIRSGYVGTTLSNAHFDLYIWNGNDWQKVNTESMITDSSGLFLLRDLTVNTAYKLVETQAPVGYELATEPFFFWIPENSGISQPNTKPSGFTGSAVQSGSTMNVPNEPKEEVETTQLHLEKQWVGEGTVPVDRITVNIYQITYLNDIQTERHLYKTVTLTSVLNWKTTVSDLPLKDVDTDGNTVTYTYSVEELQVSGYITTYSDNNASGVAGDTIIITNTEEGSGYVLPNTGGVGSECYTFSGLLITAAALMYILKNYRRKDDEDGV